MPFKFDISLTEKDYYEFNDFHLFRSPYGKNIFLTCRTVVGLLPILVACLKLLKGFSIDYIIDIIPHILLAAVVFFAFKPLMRAFVKLNYKQQKKAGKLPFSSQSVLEFYEDHFTEITDHNKTENQYSVIESVYIVDEKIIYIFINSVSAHLLPVSSFENKEQYDAFLKFLEEKAGAITVV